MNLKNVYKLFPLMVLYAGLQSHSTGPGVAADLQVSGAPGSSGDKGTCANTSCHTSGNFSPTASIQLLDGADAITEYEPGKAYTIKVIINKTGFPGSYGFQAVALDDAENQAGEWALIGPDKHVKKLSDRDYLELRSPSLVNSFRSQWIAPASGTGDVTFYAAGIASNDNAGITGDGTASTKRTIREAPTASISNLDSDIIDFGIFPNPTAELLNLQINSRTNGDFKVRIIDVTGKVTSLTPISLQNGHQVKNIPVGNLTPGLYVVQLSSNGHMAAAQMLKQ